MRCAILLIDIQQRWSDRTKETFPHFERNIQDLISLADTNEIPLIYVFAHYDRDSRDLEWTPNATTKTIDSNPPSLFLQKHPIYKNKQDKTIVLKSTFDAFNNTGLHYLLKSRGITHVFVAGLTTSVCVLNSAHGAFTRGYHVHIVKDCCADNTPQIHNSIIENYSKMMWTPLKLKNLVSFCNKIDKKDQIKSKL